MNLKGKNCPQRRGCPSSCHLTNWVTLDKSFWASVSYGEKSDNSYLLSCSDNEGSRLGTLGIH